MHEMEKGGFKWPSAKTGPWEVETTTARIGGRWELVGLSIQPLGDPSSALTSTVLKRLRLPQLFAEHRKQAGLADEALAWNPGFNVELNGRKLSPAEAERFLKSKSSAAMPHTGRPTYWIPARLAKAAQVYREARAARKNPTASVGSRFNLTSSGAAKVVKLARAQGLLPPTTRGKAKS